MHDDYLSPEDRKILNYALSNLELGARGVAAHFKIPVERVHDILRRDLAEVTR